MRYLIASMIVAYGGLAAGATDAQVLDSTKGPGSLQWYTRCQFSGGLRASSIDRAPNLPMARPVDTSSGRKLVSVADGYRVMLAFPGLDPFVNLKIERSAPGRYALDKQTVLEQMQFMADGAKGVVVELERFNWRGVDVAALNNPTLDGATISFYSFFEDKNETISTAYVLNQLPERRSFKDLGEYRSQRDKFVADWVSCLSSAK